VSELAERQRFTFGPGVVANVSGLRLPEEIDFEQWETVLRNVLLIADASPFWVGDVLAHGEWRYGEKYRAVLEQLDLKYDRARDWAYVSGNVPEAVRRMPELSWSHHRAVAKLIPSEQEHWLERAASEGWSFRQLSEQLQSERPKLEPGPAEQQVRWTLPSDRFGAWQRAAENAGVSVFEWAAGILDEAAR
jgi:hypothetical protein